MNNEKTAKQRTTFFCPMVPPNVTHNALEVYRRKSGTGGIRKSSALKEAEAKLEANFAKHRPAVSYHGAVQVELCICYKTNKDHPIGFKTTKPDVDNLEKVIYDVMGRLGFFEVGDQQIAKSMTSKCYDTQPGIYVAMQEL